ncbi:hypothetical protein AgCh_008854 [Apium graveolens]
MNRNDAFTRVRKAELAERLKERDERPAREKAEREANEMKYAKEIKIFEQRSNELKVKGLSRVSPDGVFLNVKTHKLSRDGVERPTRHLLGRKDTLFFWRTPSV